MQSAYLMRFWLTAVRSGREAVMAVTFSNGIRAEVHITRDVSER